MEKIGTYTDSLNIEIFELEDKCKKIQQENLKLQEENKKTRMFVAMYYKKAKELDKIKTNISEIDPTLEWEQF